MLTLSNPHLQVEILHPIDEKYRLGSRYCTGGYIWQITDARLGHLLTGPEYPEEPSTFNGQGIPDMFRRPLGEQSARVGDEVSCIGVGRVLRSSPKTPFGPADNPTVTAFVEWDIAQTPGELTMRTEHSFGDWGYFLERKVALSNRTVRSSTSLRNLGRLPISLYWYPHPFFPLPADGVLCQFSIPVRAPENPGYILRPDGFFVRKPDHEWQKGCYLPVEFDESAEPLSIVQKHPLLGEVHARMSYSPAFLPIWGNQRTFSFEPFIEREIHPGEAAQWDALYQF